MHHKSRDMHGYDYIHGRWMPVRIDPVDQAAIQIDGPHYAIHIRTSFTLVKSALLDTDGVLIVRIVPPVPAKGKQMHFTIDMGGSGLAQFEMFESTTLTHVPGNAIVPVNRYRRKDRMDSDAVVCHTPGGAETAQALLDPVYFGGAEKKNNQPGSARGVNEWLPDPYEPYALKLTSLADANRIWLKLDWYEKEDPGVFSTTTTTTTTTTT